MKKYIVIAVIAIILSSCQNQVKFIPGQTCAIADMVQTIPQNNRQQDSLWNIWCGSMIKGYDGKYHLFNSRWPRGTKHTGWISHSQIIYSVADHPEGPYTFVNAPLPFLQDSTTWDGATTHNPYVLKHEGKYYLYYTGTQGKVVEKICSVKSTDWWKRRNTQRIGVAVADNPAGPWKRFDSPVLNVSKDSTAFDALCVTNPAVCVGRDNKIVMLYKAVCKNNSMYGGKVRFSVAFADSPVGPFVKTNKLIFQPSNPNAKMVAEDPYIWFDSKQDCYYAIVRDVVNQFAGEDSGQLALLQSKDAITWVSAEKTKVLPRYLKMEDGTIYDAQKEHVERPFLYFDEQGVPAYLFGAFSVSNGKEKRAHSFNGRIPLKLAVNH